MIIKRKNFSNKEDLKYRNTKVYVLNGGTFKDARKSIGKTIKDLDDEQLHKLAEYNGYSNKEAMRDIPLILTGAMSGANLGSRLKGNLLKGASIGAATGTALSIVCHKQRKKQAKAAKKELNLRYK